MKRPLSGSLEDIAPPALLRLVSATSPSGVLTIESDRGALSLEIDHGRVRAPSTAELRRAGRVLGSRRGGFRFQPTEVERLQGSVMSLSDYAEAAAATGEGSAGGASSPAADPGSRPPRGEVEIHVLPAAAPEDPLRDLVAELETQANGELLFARLAVIAQDPRPWRGSLEREWRQRGWELELLPFAPDADLEGFDLVVVAHDQDAARSGQEARWLDLVRRVSGAQPPAPLVWVSPLVDAVWVHRLIDAGVAFLMPAPQGHAGETAVRFAAALTQVVDRQLQLRLQRPDPELSGSVSELVGALLSATDPDEGVRSLLLMAAEKFERGAVLMVGAKVCRSRAGFGFPLNRNLTELPRGDEVLERVIRSGEAIMEIDPTSVSARRLAGVCGIEALSPATALIPLGRLGAVAGILVADRRGGALPEIDELVVLAGRLGGAVVS
ncbi:MAG TPA: DUF4388 domain-containing protein [Chondromyces sp.]|nr:DUF4388 domain-containing protein [Chondromyces sp.]